MATQPHLSTSYITLPKRMGYYEVRIEKSKGRKATKTTRTELMTNESGGRYLLSVY